MESVVEKNLNAKQGRAVNEEGPRWGERGPSIPTWGDVGVVGT